MAKPKNQDTNWLRDAIQAGMASDAMMVVTCKRCRAWYNMDFEPHLDDFHYNPRSGEECNNTDNDGWEIRMVPYREDWRWAQ